MTKCTCSHEKLDHIYGTEACIPGGERCLCATYTPVDPEPAPKEILFGSETWEVTVTCADCGRTEELYVPIGLEVSAVHQFLVSRGWAQSEYVWVCPRDHGPKCGHVWHMSDIVSWSCDGVLGHDGYHGNGMWQGHPMKWNDSGEPV